MPYSRVPHTVHQVWLKGDPPPEGRRWCNGVDAIARAAGWAYEWWTFERVLEYSEEFSARQAACTTVQYQADVARWLILRDLGGLYLDCDVELFRLPAQLDGAWIQGIGGLWQNGAAIACPPGHRFMVDTLAAAGREPQAWTRSLCAGTHFQAKALGPDVQLWPPSRWNWEAPWKGYGIHHGCFRKWRSTRPAER